MDDIVETKNEREDERFMFHIDDVRINKAEGQEFGLNERLKSDKVDLALVAAKKFFGGYAYSNIGPQELSIKLVEGNVGEGTVIDKIIELQLPEENEAIAEIKKILEQIQQTVDDIKAREIINAFSASTILHEGIHVLLESRPGSRLAQDFERVSGFPNEQGNQSTLLDEGLAYAVQGIYAPDIELVGSITPVAREGEKLEVTIRKKLGETLRPKVKEYIEAGKVLDDDFLSFAAQEMKKLEDTSFS